MSDKVESSNLQCFQNQDIEQNRCIAHFTDLPVEIFLRICSFLDAATLVHGLSLTCKQFHQILNDDSTWKFRISQIWPNVTYPPLPLAEDDELFWKLSCIAIEKQAKLWKSPSLIEKILLNDIHYSTIDGLLLMKSGNICVSGGRDRSLALCKLPIGNSSCVVDHYIRSNAHDGWIWDLTAIRDTVYSCSWDSSVRSWMLSESGLLPVACYEKIVQSALLCVTSCNDLDIFATGSYCGKVLVFDSRSGLTPIYKYEPHTKAVLRLTMSKQYILSASEDKTVHVWDQRAGKKLKLVEISKDSFPMSMCFKEKIVYVGDSNANLHVLDPSKEFQQVKKYLTDHEKGITGVYIDSGCLITSSLDRTVQISSPTDPPRPIASLQYVNGEIAGIDYLNEVLAVSGTDAVEIWRPKVRMYS